MLIEMYYKCIYYVKYLCVSNDWNFIVKFWVGGNLVDLVQVS